MKKTVTLIAPPTAMQPGGYIAQAYADHTEALTSHVDVEALHEGDVWTVRLRWKAREAVIDASGDPRHFVDAAALFAPESADAPWITMGSAEQPLAGVLWRADQPRPLQVKAGGLGTIARHDAPDGWQVTAAWANRHWQVEFTLPQFSALDKTRQLAVAIWQGAQSQRAGLKSVSPGWLAV